MKSKAALERQERRKKRRDAVQQAKEARAKEKPPVRRPAFFGKERRGDQAEVQFCFSGLEIPCVGLTDTTIAERFEDAKEQLLALDTEETLH